MGINDAVCDLSEHGFIINADGENFTVSFPEEKASLWEDFIVSHLERGYWNEYLTDDHVVFIFNLEDGIRRYEVYNFDNSEVLAICEKLCECRIESLRSMLSENHFYKKIIG